MITADNVLDAFESLELAGIKPTDVIAADPARAAEVYAAALADLTPQDLVACVLAYLRAPLPAGKWFKEWPDVGALLALAPERRRIAETPDDAEATYARLWIVHSGICGSGAWVDGGEHGQKFERRAPERLVIDRSAAGDRRERALRAGIGALGGWTALSSISVESRPYRRGDFCTAYRNAMKPKDTNVLAFQTPVRTEVLSPGRDLRSLATRAFGGGSEPDPHEGSRLAAHTHERSR